MLRKPRGLSIAVLCSLFALICLAVPQVQAQQSQTLVFTAKSFLKTIPVRDMQNANLPPIMRRVVGTNHYTPQQLAQLHDKLAAQGYIKAANQFFTIPLLKKQPAMEAAPRVHDPVMQTSLPGLHAENMRPDDFTQPIASFDMLGASTTPPDGCAPPDTNAAVGATQVVELINCAGGAGSGTFAVYSKTGTMIVGPVTLENLWTSGVCATNGAGDDVVLYDQLAQRWILSQFAGSSGFPTDECVAISVTGDATGSYYVYDFPIITTNFNDYPKLSVWPDAYYATLNQFNTAGTAFLGVAFAAFDRAAMLTGDPTAQEVVILNSNAYSALPADLDGANLPPTGTPGIFLQYESPYLYGAGAPYALLMYQLSVNWTSPATGTLSGPTQINVDPFNDGICSGSRNCIPEPSPGEGLDSLGDRVMFRLAYRDGVGSDGHQTLVVDQTVGTGSPPSSPPSGIRWYELDAPAGATSMSSWTVAQQGTYLPTDGSSRWMGSIAMDHSGDIALGYSLSSPTINPSIAYTGRLAGDPAGQMTQPETTILTGGGVQESTFNRWGDYSSMAIDPTDDCTFWYSQEYYATTGSFNWSTHIAAFKFPSCSTGPTGTLTGQVTDAGTGKPIVGATITLTPNQITTVTDSNGNYTLTVPVGTYTATASDFGYQSQSDSETISDGETTTQNFALTLAPSATVSGNIVDGTPGGHTYGLYGEIKVTAQGVGQVADIWANPETGAYSLNLPEGDTYTFAVTPYLGGYTPASATLTNLSGNTTQNFPITVSSTCTAPGYAFGTGGFSEDFEGGVPPSGWTVTNGVTGSPVLWNTNAYWGDANYTPGSGIAATADSNNAGGKFGYFSTFDTSLVTPEIPVSSLPAGAVLKFALNYQEDRGTDALDVDVSGDGGNTWTNLAHINTNQGQLYTAGGVTYQVPLIIPSGATSIELRWHYYDLVNGFDWYAQIDNVVIGACEPISGGLVVGAVTDKNTKLGLVGAGVSDNETPSNSTKTFQNAADPNLPVGYYFLFSGTNSADLITASFSGYTSASATLNVTDNSVHVHNFALGAARFNGTPGSFDLHVMVNNSVTKNFTVHNTGDAAGSFSFLTFDFPPPSHGTGGGAPLDLVQCKHLSPLSRAKAGNEDPGCGGDDSSTLGPPNGGSAWQAITGYPGGIMDNAVAEDEGTGLVYSVGGVDGSGTTTAVGNVYNPSTQTWTAIAPLPNALEKPVAAFISGKLYVADGWDTSGNPTATLEIYDPSSNTWSTGAANPAPEGGGAAVAVLNNEMYIVGGCPTGSSCGDTPVEAYNPATNTWTAAGALAPYPHQISWESCGAIQGTIYCAGGTAGSTFYQDAYAYNASSNSWTAIAPIPVTGGMWASGYIGTPQGLLISGGVINNGATITNQGFVYTPSSNSWAALPNSINSYYRGGSACGFYKIGGSTGGFIGQTNSEELPGYTPCGTSPIPWLTINPSTGTVAAGSSKLLHFIFNGTGQAEFTTSQAYVLLEGTPYPAQMVPLTVTWDPQPIDLKVTASSNLSTVQQGDIIVYTVTVLNKNEPNHGGATETTLTYPLPAGFTDIINIGPGTCNVANNTVSCAFGSLALGASVTEEFIVTPAIAGKLTSTFTAAAREPESNPSDNTASVVVNVLGVADVAVNSYKASPGSVNVGARTTFNLNIGNYGPDTATGLTVTAPLPDSLRFVSASSGCANHSGVVICHLPDLAAGGQTTVHMTVKTIDVGADSSVVVLSTSSQDPNTTNNGGVAIVTVNAVPPPPPR